MVNRDVFLCLDACAPRELAERFLHEAQARPDSVQATFDRIALEVAGRFMAGRMSFEDADFLANAWWAALCTQPHFSEHLEYSGTAIEVYEAFDAGEYRHREDDEEVDPVAKYTRPALAALLKSVE